jgi:hypothetical protein
VPLHPQWILHKLPKINLAAPWWEAMSNHLAWQPLH